MSEETTFCPRCSIEQPATSTHCVRCGLDLNQPEVPRLHQIWREIRGLNMEWETLITQVRIRNAQQAVFSQPASQPVAYAKQEWTPKRVQNTLLSIGAGLCAIAAVSFVAVAWGHLSLAARAALMVMVTLATMAAAQLASKRGLKSTAEAVSALGYSLVVIDAASAYSLNFGGVASLPSWQFASLVAIGLTGLGVIQRLQSNVEAPGYVALAAGQVPIALSLAGMHAGLTEWTIGLSIQTITMSLVATTLKKNSAQIPAGLSNAAALISGVIATLVAIGAAAVNPQGIEAIAPLVIVAVAGVASTFIAVEDAMLRCLSFTGALAALVIDAFAVAVRTTHGLNTSITIVAIGAIVTSFAVIVRKYNIPHLLTIGVGVAVLGTATALADPLLAIASPANASVPFLSMATLVAGAAVISAASRTKSVTKDFRLAGKIVAVGLGLWVADLAVLATNITFELSLAYEAVLAAGTLVIAQLFIANRHIRYSVLTFGTIIAGQTLAWSTTDNTAMLFTLGFAALVAAAVAIADRETLPVTSIIGATFAMLYVIAQAATLNLSQDQIGLTTLITAELITVLLIQTKRDEWIGAEVILTGFSILGTLLTTGNVDSLSIALAAAAATSAIAATSVNKSLGWLSSAFVIALMWLQLDATQVDVVEAYTTPLALLVGYAGYRAWTGPKQFTSTQTFGYGLAIAFGPSLVQLLAHSTATRALGLLIAGTFVTLIGADRRMKAPLTFGALALMVTALVEMGPYFYLVPRWLGIGTAGVILVAVGATWEARRRDMQLAKQHFDSFA